MDAKIRAKKASYLRRDMKLKQLLTQGELWDEISNELTAKSIHSHTEDYNELLEAEEKKHREMPKARYAEKCNGLALFDGRTLIGFDLFGNRETYRHYFSLLERNARSYYRPVMHGKEILKDEEAFYLLTDILYTFEEQLENPEEPKPGQAGHLRWSGIEKYPGFSLDMDQHLIHMAGFSIPEKQR
jgi:hypothetical protein